MANLALRSDIIVSVIVHSTYSAEMEDLSHAPLQLDMEEERAKQILNSLMDDYLRKDKAISERMIQVMQESAEEFKRHHGLLRVIHEKGLEDIESVFKVGIRV